MELLVKFNLESVVLGTTLFIILPKFRTVS
jgi:hypothetical protein